MKVNLHTHTMRCRHASGTEREYIERAIRGGLTHLGFSDHAPYPFPDGHKSGFRMDVEQRDDYVDTILELKEEYKDRIKISLGYEVEYYAYCFKECIELLSSRPCDYIILGQHFIIDEIDGRYSGQNYPDEKNLTDYVNSVCAGIETGLYTYVAHPDLCGYAGETAISDALYTRLIECARDADVPLEINLLGIRDRRIYPRRRFFELCVRLGAPVCIGSDAHSPDVVCDTASFESAMSMVNEFGLNFIEEPKLKPLKPWRSL